MNNKSSRYTCEQVKQWDLVDYLATLGFHPAKIRNHNYWYCSPLRAEKEPSFKVDINKNCWYDHGNGKGGNLIDFAILYFQCSVGDFMRKCNTAFFLHQQPRLYQPGNMGTEKRIISILADRPLASLVLLRYLHSRKIPAPVAQQYCREIHFSMYQKKYFAIGFRNDLGGYELRNVFLKSSSSPKGITTMQNGARKIIVLEGFFELLSFKVLFPSEAENAWDFCVLNSLAFFERSLPFLMKYDSVHLFLNNDNAGQKCRDEAIRLSNIFHDESRLYAGYKDLNEWITEIGKHHKGPFISRDTNGPPT